MWLILAISQEYSCHHQHRRRTGGGGEEERRTSFDYSALYSWFPFFIILLARFGRNHSSSYFSALFGKVYEFIY